MEIIKNFGSEISILSDNGAKKLMYQGEEVDKYILLAAAMRTDDFSLAGKILRFADEFRDDDIFNSMFYATEVFLTEKRYSTNKRKKEFSVHKLFKEKYHQLTGNEIIDFQSNKTDIPDFGVSINNRLTPVEIKRDSFNRKALKQLRRYISVYGCEKGIAVGERLTVDIPSNIIFISISELENGGKGNE